MGKHTRRARLSTSVGNRPRIKIKSLSQWSRDEKLFATFAAGYGVSPIDALPLNPTDDLLVILAFVVYAINTGLIMFRSR